MQRVPCGTCGSSDVHCGTSVGYAGWLMTAFLGFPRKLTHFVCCSCGNVENFVESETDRRKIARDWPKAG